MASDMQSEIYAVIKTLADTLGAQYFNFFEPETLTGLDRPMGQKRYLTPVGPIACGEWKYRDDISLVCMSENSEERYIELLAERIELHPDTKVKTADIELSSPAYSRGLDGGRGKLATFVQLRQREKAGCKFRLHYCRIPPGYDPATMQFAKIPHYPRFAYSLLIQRNLTMVREMQKYALPGLSLGGNAATWILPSFQEDFKHAYRHLRDWTQANGLYGPKLGFLTDLSLMSLAHAACVEFISSKERDGTGVQMSECLLRQLHSFVNGRSCQYTPVTSEAKDAIKTAMARAKVDPDSSDLLYIRHEPPFLDFLNDFGSFLMVECEWWAQSSSKLAAFVDDVVPWNLDKVLTVVRSKKDRFSCSARLWPSSLANGGEEGKGFYVMGLTFGAPVREPLTIAELATSVLDYDATSSIITVSLVSHHDITTQLSQRTALVQKATITTAPASSSAATAETLSSCTKFRDAHSAISRLRYDPKHLDIEYEVGYVDRFEEKLVWLPFEIWGGKETEDQDFIPEHRIRQLRRIGGGDVVWDREKRVDLTGFSL